MPLCKSCRKMKFDVAAVLAVPRCEICGKKLISTRKICFECNQNPILKHTDFVVSLFSYRLWNKQLMFLWKKKGIRSLSKFFAEEFCVVLKKIGNDVIVPVPPRPGKIRENGWDQIDEICGFLKYFFGFKVFDVLKRVTVAEQKKLDRAGRLESIGNAYCLTSQRKLERVIRDFGGIPREVCIIDDVSTTGATLESCSFILKKLGVEKVNAITLFTVD